MYNRNLTAEDIARKLKPIFGKKIDEVYFRYSVANSLEEKNEIFQLLSGLYQKHLNQLLDKGILLEPPKNGIVSGEYPLGKVEYAGREVSEFGLREKDWQRHICISGMSGSGKTTFAINILKNFAKKDKPFLVFDWKKSFRSLLQTDKDMLCFTVGDDSVSNMFKLNINRPPQGINPKEWINTLCDLLTESFQVSFGVHKVLLETLDEAYEGWGVYNGGTHYPNWQHIKKLLEIKTREANGRETGWYESAMRIATVLTFGSFGKVVNYDGNKSLSIEELFKKKTILELSTLSNIEKKFFSEFILTYIYKLKKAQPNKTNNGFEYAILVDEAHNIFLKRPTNFMSESVTDMIYREMREYGVSLICLDQHISKLSDTVTGNSACHIAFQQQLPQDIEGISQLMQLRDNKETFSQLKVGQAVVKLSERHTFPFLIKAPYIELRSESINNDAVKLRMQCLISGFEAEEDEDFNAGLIGRKVYGINKDKYKDKKIRSQYDKVDELKKEKKENILEVRNRQAVDSTISKVSSEIKNKEVIIVKEEKEKLVNLIEKKLESGISILEIEGILSREKKYSQEKIESAINKVFKKIEEEGKEVIYVKEKLSIEENNFISYLEKNIEHNNSTVELYGLVGLSNRKGNVIKNKLLKKGLIKIFEEKNNKGWKKLIRLI